MNKKKICLLIGAVLIIILIILLRPRHIKVSLSDTDDLSVVREGSEISLTQNEKNQLIDIIEDITVMPWLYPQSTGWTYRIFTDNRTNNIIILKNGSLMIRLVGDSNAVSIGYVNCYKTFVINVVEIIYNICC